MEVLVLIGFERFEAEVIDDEEIDLGQGVEAAVIGTDGPGSIELTEHFALCGEEDVIALADGAVTEGLGDMAFSGAAGTGDEDGEVLLDEAAGCQVEDLGAVDGEVESEVELLHGLMVSEAGLADPEG